MPESPLVRFKPAAREPAAPDADVVLGERPFLGYLNLRGKPQDPAFVQAAESTLGVSLPVEPNSVAGSDEHGVLWLGPEEWLVVTPPDAQTELQRSLEKALEGCFSSVVDVSSGNTAIAVSGPRARELLAKGTTIDLHPRTFPVGHCAQTHFAHAGALICLWDPAPRFELVVRRSFADYLWQWLLAASRDISLAVDPPPGG